MEAPKDIYRPKKDYETTLGETSFSVDKGSCLLDSDVQAYDFDKLCKSLKKMRGNSTLSSCDALVEKNDFIYLVEFKNQPNKNIDNMEIQKKAFDSVSQLLMTWARDTSQQDLSKKLLLFVIFHDTEDDKSFEKIRNKTYSFAKPDKAEPLLFGIHDDLKSLYREVHTIDISKFVEKYYPACFEGAN